MNPCDQCEEIYGESRDYGGSHYHCSNCGEVSSCQGHYGLLPNEEWGFKCVTRNCANTPRR